MIGFHRARVLDDGILSVVVGVVFLIKRGDLLGRSSAEDFARVQSGQVAFRDHLDGAEGIASQLIKVVVDADLLESENRRHSGAELLLRFIFGRGVVGLEVGRVGLGQRFSVHFSVWLERNLVDFHIVRGNHIIRQAF